MGSFLLGVTALLPALSSVALAQGAADGADVGVRAIIADLDQPIAPGCVAGAFHLGQAVSIVPQGYADLAAQRPLDGDTLFYAASISKQFTALLAAHLVAEGRLALNDDIRRYLPELPVYRAPVTVAMLMQHTSGVRDSLGLLRMAGMENVGLASKDEALKLLFLQQDTIFTPGTEYSYSNGGYLLLAEIVERVSGRPFADYAQQVIFDPLGMESAFFLNDNEPRPGTYAHGYVPEGDGFAQRDTFPRFSGSGGLMLSMNDLARYEDDIERTHRVWTPEIARIMLTPGLFADGTPVDDGKGSGYGGGLHLAEKGGARIVEHTGSAEAFKHAYIRLPDEHRAFALLCNRGDWTASAKLKEIMATSGHPYPGLPQIQPEGLFHSDELDADYRLSAEGDGLRVEIISPIAPEPWVLQFVPQDDGGFHADSMTITPTEDPARIVLSRGRIGDIALTRAGEGAVQ